MRNVLLGLLVLVLALSLGACKKQPPDVAEPAPLPLPAEPAPAPRQVPEAVQQLVGNFSKVFFEFDSAAITEEGQAALRENAEIMSGATDVKVEIQGHADERGTTDYNLTLGQQRADAVMKYLVAHGVAPSRLSTISYGEERPVDPSQTEVAWSRNRRAEFRITWGQGEVRGTTE